MKIRVTQDLTGAWEIWECEVPDDADLSDPSTLDLEYVELVDSGNDSASITECEVI